MVTWRRCCQCSFWIKYCMFFINFLVWASSMAATGISVLAHMENDHQGLMGHLPTVPAKVLGSIGVAGCAVGCLGFIAALRENIFLLRLFCIGASALFFGEIVGGILMFVLMNYVKSVIASHLMVAITVYQEDEVLQDFIDFIQQKLECCGETNYRDWDVNVSFNCSDTNQTLLSRIHCHVPMSCCAVRGDFNCGLRMRPTGELLMESTVFTRGCTEPVLQAFKFSIYHVSILAFGIGILEVISVILANRLAFSIFQSTDAYPPREEDEISERSCVDDIVKLEPLSGHRHDELTPITFTDDNITLEPQPCVRCNAE